MDVKLVADVKSLSDADLQSLLSAAITERKVRIDNDKDMFINKLKALIVEMHAAGFDLTIDQADVDCHSEIHLSLRY